MLRQGQYKQYLTDLNISIPASTLRHPQQVIIMNVISYIKWG